MSCIYERWPPLGALPSQLDHVPLIPSSAKMKTSTTLTGLLHLVAAHALKESISNRPGDICLSSKLFAASKPPLCSSNHDEHPIVHQDLPQGEKVLSDTESPWSSSTNCYRNATIDMEFCVYVSSSFANGKGTAVITDELRLPQIAKAVTRYSAKGLAVDQLPENLEPLLHGITEKPINVMNSKFKVVPMEGKGFGAVATGPIARGEIIIQESVSMLIDYAAFTRVPRSTMKQLQRAAIDGLPSAHRARFLDMSAGHEGPTDIVEEQVERVLVTNSFDVDMEDGERDDDFYAVFVESE